MKVNKSIQLIDLSIAMQCNIKKHNLHQKGNQNNQKCSEPLKSSNAQEVGLQRSAKVMGHF